MIKKKYRIKRTHNDIGMRSSSKLSGASLICLFAPVWVPIVWLDGLPLSNFKGETELFLGLSVGLPFLPFIVFVCSDNSKDLKTYLICLLLASPFLVVAAFILWWIAAASRYGP
ncbi:hypothetical protein [Wielerella bovis]|uniref:hypothetical protein n=1 Tax=Wielerella bovis TaxID=2917790 RepID=UPI002018C255|nr:hypothetical protein [Wielerella bovis]ULJ60177.1 hypothetical protein MIS44_11070 [Wielerella bovis]